MTPRHAAPVPSGRGEPGDRGAVLPFVALCLTLVVVSAALAIDLGRLSVAAREARTVVDLAALDAVRALDGSDTATVQPTVEAAAARSAERNGFVPGPDGTLTVVLGTVDPVSRTFTPTTATEVPNAVQVSVQRDQDHLFVPGAAAVDRSAVATSGGIEAGVAVAATTVVGLDETLVLDALLGDVLGGPVGLTVTDWQALADAPVDLYDLATVGAGLPPVDAQELLDQTWTTGSLIAALDAMPLPPAADAALAGLIGVGTDPLPLRLADSVAVDLTDPATRPFAIGVAELLRLAALTAGVGRTFAVDLPPAPLGVSAVTTSVHVVEPPGVAFGPVGTTVRSARLRAAVVAAAADPLVVPGLAPAPLSVPLVLDTGSSEATVAGATCVGDRLPADVAVTASTASASVTVGAPAGSLASGLTTTATLATVGEPPPGPDPAARVDVDVERSVTPVTGSLSFPVPYQWSSTRSLVDAGDPAAVLVVAPSELDVVLLAPTAVAPSTVADAAADALDPLVADLSGAVLAALGADLGAVTVSIPVATCRPALLVA